MGTFLLVWRHLPGLLGLAWVPGAVNTLLSHQTLNVPRFFTPYLRLCAT
jgi:hypothetical protein